MGIWGVQGGRGLRIATASDRAFCMGCGRAGRRGRRPLRKCILWCVGEGLCPSHGRPQESPLRKGCMGCGTKSAGGVEPRPYGGLQGVQWAGDRKGRPYGGLQGVRWAGRRGRRPLRKGILWCVGEGLCPSRGRPQGSPLRKGYMGCGTKSAGGVEPRPYEGLQEVTACGGGLLRCIRGAFCSARRYYGPPGPRFGPGRDRR